MNSGANGNAVTALPDGGYHFVQWSDGSTANPRTDTNVTANVSVTASFAANSSGTPVPVMDGWWLLPGILAGLGIFARRRKE